MQQGSGGEMLGQVQLNRQQFSTISKVMSVQEPPRNRSSFQVLNVHLCSKGPQKNQCGYNHGISWIQKSRGIQYKLEFRCRSYGRVVLVLQICPPSSDLPYACHHPLSKSDFVLVLFALTVSVKLRSSHQDVGHFAFTARQ